MEFTSVAARLLPPFLPSTMSFGIEVKGFTICFDSFTFTKPTGAAIMPAGVAFSSRINRHSYINAVGAFPKANKALGCSSTAKRMPACVRVIPNLVASSATRGSLR